MGLRAGIGGTFIDAVYAILPVENRFFLLVIPVLLSFEREVAGLLGRLGRRT